MTHLPIQSVTVRGYGCIREARFDLSPIHALIGPNDSGKSTALRAIRTSAQFAAGDFGPHPNERPLPFDPMLDPNKPGTAFDLAYPDGVVYRVETRKEGVVESVLQGGVAVASEERRGWSVPGLLKAVDQPAVAAVRERLTKATMVRFDPNALRRPANQILADQPIQFADETGGGLASVYQAINSRDVDAFVAIRDEVRGLFPTVQNVLVPTQGGPGAQNLVALQARLIDNTLVSAQALSEGLLYFLGYAALRFLERATVFLVEEPENGLHPARIREVMGVLRKMSETSQVVIATHSPLVVNELGGSEITVVTRHPEKGTQPKLLRDVPGFDDAAKVYRPGEFWVSYADGEAEEPLLTGRPRT